MPRRPSPRQRMMIYLIDEGKCRLCGAPLLDDFHVDHILEFACGGETEVWNLRGTCPTCNLTRPKPKPGNPS